MSEWLDYGHGVTGELRDPFDDGRVRGFAYRHPRPDNGEICEGYAPCNAEDGYSWTVESIDPLTLSPSLLCGICGHHGFVRQGRWVPA